jgi:non-ribosomal peptide synthetase component F
VAVLRIRSDDDRNHGRLAGKTYVPLDPQFPPARLAYMIADAQAG